MFLHSLHVSKPPQYTLLFSTSQLSQHKISFTHPHFLLSPLTPHILFRHLISITFNIFCYSHTPCFSLFSAVVPGTLTALLNFANSRRLRIAGSWYQGTELHLCTWYSNARRVAKETDHILISTRRIFQSAEFFATDHRLVATFKLHVKSKRISRCNPNVFYLEKLKDLTCAHENAVTVSNRFERLGALRIRQNCGIPSNVKLKAKDLAYASKV